MCTAEDTLENLENELLELESDLQHQIFRIKHYQDNWDPIEGLEDLIKDLKRLREQCFE